MAITQEDINKLKSYFLSKEGGAVAGDVKPSETEVYDLGTASQKWEYIYAKNLVADSISGEFTASNADTVDNYHANLTPTALALLPLDAFGRFPAATYYDALLTDGTRSLAGDLSVLSGYTIDGVDISEHAHTGAAGDGSTIGHASLTGLDADDHPQYTQRAQDEIVTGDWMFTHLVDRSAGWQFLPDDKIFRAIPHDLIMYGDADSASIELGERDINGEPAILLLDDDDGPTSYLKVGRGDLAATLSATDPTYRLWIGHEDPASAPFSVESDGHVNMASLQLYGDLESDNYVSNQAGWKIFESGFAEFNDVSVRGAIKASVFTRETISAIAGRAIITEAAVLIADVALTDDFILVDTPAFVENEIVEIRIGSADEWMRILDDGTAIEGGYMYMVDRDLAGMGASEFLSGDAVISKGVSTIPESAYTFGSFDAQFGGTQFGGGGFTTLGGFLTLEGSRDYGPYFGVARRFGPAYNQIVDIARIGRVQGFLGIDKDEYGIAIGDSLRSLIYTYTDGLTISTAGGDTQIDDNGVSTTSLSIVPYTPAYVDGKGYLYFTDEWELRMRVKEGATEIDVSISGATSSLDHGNLLGLSDNDHPRYEFTKSGFDANYGSYVDMSFTDGTRTFSIAPTGVNFKFWIDGVEYTKTAEQTVIITDTEGLWYIYFNGSGVLEASQTPWTFTGAAVPVATVYWDADNNQSILVQYELHSWELPRILHEYLHDTFGTRYDSGLAVSIASAQLNVTGGELHDEDISIEITDNDTPTTYWEQPLTPLNTHVYTRSGANGYWRQQAQSTTPVYLVANTLQYNYWTGATWTTGNVSVGQYVAYWVMATGDIEHPVVLIPGQEVDTTLANARDGNSIYDMQFGSVPTNEFKIIARVIVRSIAGAPYYELIEVNDYRIVADEPTGTFTASDHGGLTGLLDDDHPQYILAAGDTMTGDLTFSDTGIVDVDTVQFNTSFANGTAEGRLQWNSEDGTLEVGMPGGNVNLQIGQENLVRVKNTTGGTLYNGTPVYVNGASGSRPTVAPADADGAGNAAEVFGVLTEDIADSGSGYVTTFGLVRGVNTGAFSAGDHIYLSTTPGTFTTTPPAYPAEIICVGCVLFSNVSDGVIFVNPHFEKTFAVLDTIYADIDHTHEGLGADASDITYTPTTPADWVVEPAYVDEALDELADRVTTVEESGGSGPSSSEIIDSLTSQVDGITDDFTLSQTPYNDQISVFYNGLRQDVTQYSLSGATLTMAFVPTDGSTLEVQYLIQSSTIENVELDIMLVPAGISLVVGDAVQSWYYEVGTKLAGANVVDFAVRVVTAGTSGSSTFQLRRVRSGTPADVCSTKPAIDSGETSSITGTAAVIDTNYDDLAAGDLLYVDCDSLSTTAPKGLMVKLYVSKT